MSLPASVTVLGLFVDAFEARTSQGPRACYLADRTARRAFAGGCLPRHWCCPLSAFVDVLVERQVIDLAGAPMQSTLPVALAFASTMTVWDEVARNARASLRAHLRYAAADVSMKIAFLHRAGFDFAMNGDSSVSPLWISGESRPEPLSRLRRECDTTLEIADRVGLWPGSIKRWFDGHRPTYASLEHVAEEVASLSGRRAADERRDLFVHYSLSDLVTALSQPHRALDLSSWLSEEDAGDLASVTARTIRCAVSGPPHLPREALVVCAFATPPSTWFEHVVRHGGEAWAQDLALARRDYEEAGVIEPQQDFVAPKDRFEHVLRALPRARPRELERRAEERRRHAKVRAR